MGKYKEGYRTLTRREEYLVRAVLKDKGHKIADFKRYLAEQGYDNPTNIDAAICRWRPFCGESIKGLLEFCDYDERLSFFETEIGYHMITPYKQSKLWRDGERDKISERFYDALFEFERDYLMSDEEGKREMAEKLEGITWKSVEDKLSEVRKNIEAKVLENPEILEKLEQLLEEGDEE